MNIIVVESRHRSQTNPPRGINWGHFASVGLIWICLISSTKAKQMLKTKTNTMFIVTIQLSNSVTKQNTSNISFLNY